MYEEMIKFNEEMIVVGVMFSGDGFLFIFCDSYCFIYLFEFFFIVVVGFFDVVKEVYVCGFWIVCIKDVEEVLLWVKRIFFKEGEVVVRCIVDLDDLGDVFIDEFRDREGKM